MLNKITLLLKKSLLMIYFHVKFNKKVPHQIIKEVTEVNSNIICLHFLKSVKNLLKQVLKQLVVQTKIIYA